MQKPAPAPNPSVSRTLRLDAAAIADAQAHHVPGSVLIALGPAGPTTLAVGSPGEVDAHITANPHLPAPERRISLPGSTLIPALVNAHTHLDLTHLGPFEHDPDHGLTPWLAKIRAGRLHEPADIARSVQLGIDKSIAGGVAAVGDIAGWTNHGPTLVPWQTLAASPVLGISYVEYFAIGTSQGPALDAVESLLDANPDTFAITDPARARAGLQPHAPYTVSRAGYAWTLDHARSPAGPIPLSTHLAESHAERRFIAAAEGPKRDLLESFGVWDDAILDDLGAGEHPIAHLERTLASAPSPWLVAHVNDADDAGIQTLARTRTSVAYCPRSSAYFAAERGFGPHRYQDMLGAGVNVCLGTDSIVNLDTPDRISTLDDMRLLHRRDALEPRTALAMGTTRGAEALGLDPRAFAFTPGAPLAGVVEIPGAADLASALRTDAPPRPRLVGTREIDA